MRSQLLCGFHCAIALSLLVGAGASAQAADVQRPNVLFIAVDDLNDWIGCLGGHPDAKTPHIDGLAASGVLFTRSYCAAPACNPSRAALMTGVRPSTSGVYHNNQPWRKALPRAVTLPQLFMKHGYDVAGCGKIYHGAFPDPPSWRRYLKRPGDPLPKQRPVNGIPNTAHFDWGPVDAGDQQMADHAVVDWAIDELGKQRDQPFFLACGIYRPHLPWYAPQKYFDMFPPDQVALPKLKDDDLADVPRAGVRIAKPQGDHRRVTTTGNYRKAVQGYLASIAYADYEVGRLLAALEKSGQADNTIVILWGDHGWHLGEKQHWRKFTLWEEATRAPLMIRAPGLTKPAQRCGRTVSFMDIYPTLADLCGLPIDDKLEGASLRPLLANVEAQWDRPALTTHGRNNHAVRSERWRYIRYADGGEELYDHDVDPLEWNNLADKSELQQVKQRLAKWIPQVNAPDAETAAKKRPKRKTPRPAAAN